MVRVSAGGQESSDLNAQKILKKLQSSKSILFHNSTETNTVYSAKKMQAAIVERFPPNMRRLSSMKKPSIAALRRYQRSQQLEFENLLGRLQTKYKVGLSIPTFDFGYFPFSISLGDKNSSSIE